MVNLSGVDRLVHIILGALVTIASLMMNQGLWSVTVLIVGILIVLMGIIGWSGVYSILGISTKRTAHSKISGNDIKKAVKGHMEAKEAVSTSKKTTKKSPVKKSITKKAPAKKAAAKTTTTKAVAKKAPVKKAAAKTTTKKTK